MNIPRRSRTQHSPHTPAGNLAWAKPSEALRLIALGRTFPVAIRVALTVGVILTATNQGSVLLSGTLTEATVIRIGVNFLVPYVVSSIGYLAPFRVRPPNNE